VPSVIYKGHAHSARESQIPKLSNADENGQFVKVRCKACKITRHYRPRDIRKLIGHDQHVLKLKRHFRCEKCRSKDEIDVEFTSMTASEHVGLVIRELVDIKMVKKPIWRDRKI
jgi:predicted nucleic-acid-binding Zn-ribbon protein